MTSHTRGFATSARLSPGWHPRHSGRIGRASHRWAIAPHPRLGQPILRHFLLELGVATLQIVAHLVRLDILLAEDLAHRRVAGSSIADSGI
jgi:hypothetical protein